MANRLVPALLIALLAILHAQLWLGRGSLPNVQKMTLELAQQTARNTKAQSENTRLEAEVRDLKEGLDMVEERARMELGMLRPNEIFVNIRR